MARIFINLHTSFIFEKFQLWIIQFTLKKRKKLKVYFYFFAITAITAAAVVYVIREGQRIKTENELLAYEVW